MKPDLVTLQGATDLLNDYVREGIRQMWAAEMYQHAREARRTMGDGITVRQVRYMADAIAEPTHESTGRGDARLLDAVEVAFLSIILLTRLMQISGGARLWAGMASHAPEIRKALRHPASRMGLSIDWRGRVSLMPLEQAEADRDAYVFDLAGTRADVDRLIADRRQSQPWEWAGWRKTPAKELRVT